MFLIYFSCFVANLLTIVNNLSLQEKKRNIQKNLKKNATILKDLIEKLLVLENDFEQNYCLKKIAWKIAWKTLLKVGGWLQQCGRKEF